MNKFRRYLLTAEFTRLLLKKSQESAKEYSKSELLAIAKKICREYDVPTLPIIVGEPGPGRDGLYTARRRGNKATFNIVLRRWDLRVLLHELAHHIAFVEKIYVGHGTTWQEYFAKLLDKYFDLTTPEATTWAKKEASFQPKTKGE